MGRTIRGHIGILRAMAGRKCGRVEALAQTVNAFLFVEENWSCQAGARNLTDRILVVAKGVLLVDSGFLHASKLDIPQSTS